MSKDPEEELNEDQRYVVQSLRERVRQYVTDEMETLHRAYPELEVECGIGVYPSLRGRYVTVPRKEDPPAEESAATIASLEKRIAALESAMNALPRKFESIDERLSAHIDNHRTLGLENIQEVAKAIERHMAKSIRSQFGGNA